jgi:hypothetical protein
MLLSLLFAASLATTYPACPAAMTSMDCLTDQRQQPPAEEAPIIYFLIEVVEAEEALPPLIDLSIGGAGPQDGGGSLILQFVPQHPASDAGDDASPPAPISLPR